MKPFPPHRLARGALLALALLGVARAGEAIPAVPATAAAAAASRAETDAALARCFSLQRSQPAEAMRVAEALLRPGTLGLADEIKAQSCLGMASGISGDAAGAAKAAGRMQQLLADHPMPPGFTMRALSNAGAIEQLAGHIHAALELYRRSYDAAEGEDKARNEIAALTNIASIHSEALGDPGGAESLYRQAVSIAAAIDEPLGQNGMLLHYNHALNLERLGHDAEASRALDAVLALAAQEHNQLLRWRVASERGAIAARAGKRAQAAALLVRTRQAQHQLADPSGESTTLSHLSQVQRAAGQPQAALSSALEAEHLASAPGFEHERLRAMQAEVAALKALGNFERALAVEDRATRLETRRLREFNLEGLARLQARQREARGEREMAELRHQSQMQELKLRDSRLLRDASIIAVAVLAALGALFMLLQHRNNRSLRRLSRQDTLTGLMNRRAAMVRMAAELDETPGGSARGVVLLADVDHFKSINDRHGHDAGDRVLTALSERMRSLCRRQDMLARWGGEEFMLACPQLTLAEAQAVAERLRSVATATPVALAGGSHVNLTLSIGFAAFPFHGEVLARESWQDTLQLADAALYAAKSSGRDTWVGLWGSGDRGVPLDEVIAAPERAAAAGAVTIVGLRPVRWPDRDGQDQVPAELAGPRA
ncbi:MAG TPA: diguanylate cyclase [Rhodanobacteraceae bacterium]|nr:diguanylate cyclase [Rhodanobacteraceae bacterium]